MASNNTILIKRSAVPGKVPTVDNLGLGELAINTYDGRLFTKRQFVNQLGDTEQAIIEFGSTVPIGNVFFVSATGSDSSNGETWASAFATIEAAVNAAAQRNGQLTLIDVGPGVYTTRGNIDVPDNCIVRAASQSVVIQPDVGYEQNNGFRVGSGCLIEGFEFRGWVHDNLVSPTTGFAVVFRPGATINRPPTVHNVITTRIANWGNVPPPINRVNKNPLVGNGMGVVLADRLQCNPNSTVPMIVVIGANSAANNGIAFCAKNGSQVVVSDSISSWAHIHALAIDGGMISLSACTTRYGDFTMYSVGASFTARPPTLPTIAIDIDGSQTIAINKPTIVDQMWNALVSGGYTSGLTGGDEQTIRTVVGDYIDTIKWIIASGQQSPILNYISLLFDTAGIFKYPTLQTVIVTGIGLVTDSISLLLTSTPSIDTVNNVRHAVVETINNPTIIPIPSNIIGSAHQWSAVLAGVVSNAFPPRGGQSIEDSIVELNGGLVVASGQDDQGNMLLISTIHINTTTGEITGAPFDQSVNRIATRAAIARSF